MFNIVIRVSTGIIVRIFIYTSGWIESGIRIRIRIFRVNYIIRGLQVTAGEHKVEFKFDPKEMANNKTISWVVGNIVGIFILVAIGMGINYLMHHPLPELIVKDASYTHIKHPNPPQQSTT